MADEIQKLDLNDAAEQLRDKIKFAFADTIPDEQWLAMIQAELKKFSEPRVVPNSYDSRKNTTKPSEFSEIAQGILRAHMAEQLEAKIKGGDYLPDGATFVSIVQDWMTANVDEMRDSIMGAFVTSFMVAITSASVDMATTSIAESLKNGAVSIPGIRDPNNVGYDTLGNWMGQ